MKGKAAAVGMFDGVHLGHQALVRQLCALAEARGLEAAAFTFDRHPLEVIAPDRAPLMLSSLAERMQLLRQAGADQALCLAFDHDLRQKSAADFMAMLRSDYGVELLAIGFNHRFGHNRSEGFADYVRIGQRLGIEVVQADELEIEGLGGTVSSSSIRKALLEGRLADANAMLGRPYSITGLVGHGQGIGRTIGFPTANVQPEQPRRLVPKEGVYAALAQLGSESWPAMVNIGRRPTIAQGLEPTIEANLIGYSGDLYGQELRLDFCERLRDEKRFASLDALCAQLRLDQERAMETIYNEQSKTNSEQ